ncbi:hypothetical protein BO86DRAFT_448471 [Aspergillus japonicus CBS 114.51]|uniref:PRISE-like Rossmann-fold domain-containing protein n=1 Tax=Aspergillus japonicus CBS 114.51 TaxID=1448312 RepID=A0A8T8WZV2_ASPJA|nr:hypothetical protein BO86DRAFT_448471 [Aspergillus japonicus CBS 114.51]RAH81335.1 hypothetical protein BO86DRAFT_448471 [Aspergillus japonicus CBS 114.51]
MTSDGKHALIFGASGISGWSLLNQCVSYPSPTSFRRITGLCNRPLAKEESLLPDDSRLRIIPGIDLTATVDTVIEQLKTKVDEVETVDVVFFCAYVQTSDPESSKRINTQILRTAIEATNAAAPNLEVVILQTGGMGYGLGFPKEVNLQAPLHEDLPRIPEPWHSNIFYYSQYDLLTELSQRHGKWTFSEIRPDGIVGFAPGSNAMNMAHGIAFYLTLYRQVHGAGARVPFPGKPHGYHASHSDTFQDILSKMEIFAALNRDRCGNGSTFNSADGEVVRWAQVWPGLCAYIGLVGCEPDGEKRASMQEFVEAHMETWKALIESKGLKKGFIETQNWDHVRLMLLDFDFDRQYSLDRARAAGFRESIDTVEGYKVAFDRMAKARLIPAFR